jgi:hypothetical protein
VNQFAANFDKVLNGMDVKVPTQVAEMVQANLDQMRSAYEKAAENMKAVGEAATTALTKQQALTHELGNRVIENTNANIAATFDVAQQLARSRSVQDMLKIQTEFAQTQSKRIAEQANETLSLAMKTGQEAFAAWSRALPGRAS